MEIFLYPDIKTIPLALTPLSNGYLHFTGNCNHNENLDVDFFLLLQEYHKTNNKSMLQPLLFYLVATGLLFLRNITVDLSLPKYVTITPNTSPETKTTYFLILFNPFAIS